MSRYTACIVNKPNPPNLGDFKWQVTISLHELKIRRGLFQNLKSKKGFSIRNLATNLLPPPQSLFILWYSTSKASSSHRHPLVNRWILLLVGLTTSSSLGYSL
ncbi:unnamed protein product [Lactuca virosa]|uniref:Uncharacterized protein n=1 Tax=Lactuca virosa TaxID=75947 RepID=A0AAU9NHG2_9ASTR|nr:unnamed protein product [Lactuca virosa]